jgi:hypothetical protein
MSKQAGQPTKGNVREEKPSPISTRHRDCAPPATRTERAAPFAELAHAAFPRTPGNDLIFRGGRLIIDLVFKNCYVGSYWSTQAGQSDRANIDKTLGAAMSDENLNNVVRQYYGNHQITSTSLPSIVLPADPSPEVTKSDVKRFAAALFRSGGLNGIDFDNTEVNFMLPPRVVLSSDDAGGGQRSVPAARPAVGLPTEEDEDSLHGLGGYHGSALGDGRWAG